MIEHLIRFVISLCNVLLSTCPYSALETESVGSNPGHGEVVFFWAFFFFLLLLLSPPCDFSLSQCLLACEFRFTTVYGGGKKRINMEKILAAPSVEAKLRSKCDVWERGFKKNICKSIRTNKNFTYYNNISSINSNNT